MPDALAGPHLATLPDAPEQRLMDAAFAGVHLRARPVPWSARSLSQNGATSFGGDQGTGQPSARPVPWSKTSILVSKRGEMLPAARPAPRRRAGGPRPR